MPPPPLPPLPKNYEAIRTRIRQQNLLRAKPAPSASSAAAVPAYRATPSAAYRATSAVAAVAASSTLSACAVGGLQPQFPSAVGVNLLSRVPVLPDIPPLPETFQILEQMGRGSSHKINFKLNVLEKILLTTGPDKLSMLQKEIQYYKRLNEAKIRAPIVDGWTAYYFFVNKELRVGYVATKVTGKEYKFMQLGLAKKLIFTDWQQKLANAPAVYKIVLKKLRDDMTTIIDSKLYFEDFQRFINEKGELWVIDPTGIALGQTDPNYGELKYLRDVIDSHLKTLG